MDSTDAEQLIRVVFDVTGKAERLTSERDLNFRISDGNDTARYLLKITNPAEPPNITDFQTAALLHIHRHAPDLPVSRVMPTREGLDTARVALADGNTCSVRLLTYLQGQVQQQSTPSLAQRAALGQMLARLDLALQNYRHPASQRPLLWDLVHGASQIRPLAQAIALSEKRALALEFLEQYEREVLPMLPDLRRQVIHNDFNPHNILVSAQDPAQISGILDFGDMVEAPLVCDLAVAASYQVDEAVALGAANAMAPALALIQAYHQNLPLTDAERDVLWTLIALRHILTLAITEWRAGQFPENSRYILRNHARAWQGLRQLASLSPQARQASLRTL